MAKQGLYFDEIELNTPVETMARTITEADIMLFAGLTGDYNPIHTDAMFAAQQPFGERIAHGLLIVSIVSGLAYRLGLLEGTADALTGVEWKFRGPVKIGDTIRARLVASKKRALPGHSGGLVTFDVTVLNQRDEEVQKGSWTVVVHGRE